MRAPLKAIAEHLQAGLDGLGGARITVHRDYAYGVAAPYVILKAGSHPTHGEQPLVGPLTGENGGEFVAIHVGVSTDQARWVADRVRAVLSPGLRASRVPSQGRVIEVLWTRSEGDVSVDRDVTLPGTNTHPAVAHESYEFSSLPT